MSYYFKDIKPGLESESENEDLGAILQRGKDSDDEANADELQTLSFGSLKKADSMLEAEENKDRKARKLQKKIRSKHQVVENEGSSEEEQGGFFEEDDKSKHGKQKKKHAPTEHSSKKRVPKVRRIPGLEVPPTKNNNLYQDIRFDKSMGEAMDLAQVRRRYKFLDEYRQKEIEEMERTLNDKKIVSKLNDYEVEEIQHNLKQLKSRLESVQNRDLEGQIVKEYEKEMNLGNKGRYHLKKSERRKVIQKWKFDHMMTKQREKVMERKRKKRLGKEFKQFEFHKPSADT